MPQKLPQRDPIASYRRGVIAQRVVGACQCACAEARPEALIADSDPLICEECKRRSEGRSANDDHHVASAANDPTTIPIPVNDHCAELSVAQRDWPKETLENRDGSPLLLLVPPASVDSLSSARLPCREALASTRGQA